MICDYKVMRLTFKQIADLINSDECWPSKMSPWEAGHIFTPTGLLPQTPRLEFLYENCLQGQLAHYRRKGKTVPALSGTVALHCFCVGSSGNLCPPAACVSHSVAHHRQSTGPSTQEALHKCTGGTS